jgi:hypothetical protein
MRAEDMRGRYTIKWYVGVVYWYILTNTLLQGMFRETIGFAERLFNLENAKEVLEAMKTPLHYNGGLLYDDMSTKSVAEVTELVFNLYTKSYDKIADESTWKGLFVDTYLDGDTTWGSLSVFHGSFYEAYKKYCEQYKAAFTEHVRNQYSYFGNKTLKEWLSEKILQESEKSFKQRCYSKFEIFLLLDKEGLSGVEEDLARKKQGLNFTSGLIKAVSVDQGINKLLQKKDLVGTNQQTPLTLIKTMPRNFKDWTAGVHFGNKCLERLDSNDIEKVIVQAMQGETLVSPPLKQENALNNENGQIQEVPRHAAAIEFVRETNKQKQRDNDDESDDGYDAETGQSSTHDDNVNHVKTPVAFLDKEGTQEVLDAIDNTTEQPLIPLSPTSIPEKTTWWQGPSLLQKAIISGSIVAIICGAGIVFVKKTDIGKQLWERLCWQQEQPSLNEELEKIVEDIMALYKQVGLTFEDRKKQQEMLIENLSPLEIELIQEEVKKRLFSSRWYFLYEQDVMQRIQEAALEDQDKKG